MVCLIAAVFAAIAAGSEIVNQRLGISDRLAEARQGVGRLKYLGVVMTTESSPWEEIAEEYEEIAKAYPELIEYRSIQLGAPPYGNDSMRSAKPLASVK